MALHELPPGPHYFLKRICGTSMEPSGDCQSLVVRKGYARASGLACSWNKLKQESEVSQALWLYPGIQTMTLGECH